MIKFSSGLSNFLNASRWIAAVIVCINHLRSLFFINYSEVSHPTVFDKFFYFLTSLGHEAVEIFFIMSGFLVGGKIIERMKKEQFFVWNYSVDRISRLYAVYILALILTFTFDMIGNAYFPSAGYYNGSLIGPIGAINGRFDEQWGISVFIGNLMMLQTILVPTYGSNGPLWSLANEFWYYVAGPLLFCLFFHKAKIMLRFFAGSLLVVFFLFFPPSIVSGFFLWLPGALFVFTHKGYKAFVLIGPLILLFSLILKKLGGSGIQLIDLYLLPLGFIICMSGFQSMSGDSFGKRFNQIFADFSYSLYLIHFPLMVLLASAIFVNNPLSDSIRWSPTLLNYTFSAIILVAVIGLCYLFSRITEAQTSRIRNLIYQHIHIKQ